MGLMLAGGWGGRLLLKLPVYPVIRIQAGCAVLAQALGLQTLLCGFLAVLWGAAAGADRARHLGALPCVLAASVLLSC